MKLAWSITATLLLVLLSAGCGRNQQEEAASRMLRLCLLLATFSADAKDGRYPDMSTPESMKTALSPLREKRLEADPGDSDRWSEDIFIHPSSGKPFMPNPQISGLTFADIQQPSNAIAFFAPEPDGNKRLVGYVDGHSEWVDEATWPRLKSEGGAD